MKHNRILQILNDHPIPFLLAVSFPLTIPRLTSGIPMGVDTTSHLYKILFFYQNLITLGYIPSWTPDWYAGTNILTLYPPLGYILTTLIAIPLKNPVLAYKIVESFFYMITPSIVYFLARELDFSNVVSLLSALIFALTPQIIENLLFYDRFPNIIALPILCLLIITLNKTWEEPFGYTKVIFPSILLALLILTHHLSALYVMIIIAIMALVKISVTREVRRTLITSVYAVIGGLGISSLWILPFITELNRLVENPFYNRNVIDSAFMKISYFLSHIITYTFGIVQFALALTAVYYFTKELKGKRGLNPLPFLVSLLFSGLALFEGGLLLIHNVLKGLGQITVIIAFLFTIVWIVLNLIKKKNSSAMGMAFTILWFLVFMWLGLGGLAIPFSNPKAPPYLSVPLIEDIWMSLDVQRFWLLLAIPISILSGYTLHRAFFKIKEIKKPLTLFAYLLIIIIGASGVTKAYYSLTQPINEYLPQNYTTANTDIPIEIIDYFTAKPLYGRILGIRCPFWIYLLPIYTGKPLIDGWYPQGKVLQRIINVNDYRLNDLEATKNEERISTWKNLIEDSDRLAINWIMIGDDNQTFQQVLMNDFEYKKDLTVSYKNEDITIYESTIPHCLLDPLQMNNQPATIVHITPDLIECNLPNSKANRTFIIKEAYSPNWNVKADGIQFPVEKSSDMDYNYISLTVTPEIESLTLYYDYPSITPYLMISIISTLTLILLFLLARGKSKTIEGK